MKVSNNKKTNLTKKDNVLRVWIALIIVCLTGIAFFVLPPVLSNDPCIKDWDVACTYAPKIIQLMSSSSYEIVAYFVIAYVIMPILLLLSVIILLRRRTKEESRK